MWGAVCGETDSRRFQTAMRWDDEIWLPLSIIRALDDQKTECISGSSEASAGWTRSSSPHALMLERDQGGGVLISLFRRTWDYWEVSWRRWISTSNSPVNDSCRATGLVPTTSSDVGSLWVTGPVFWMFLFDFFVCLKFIPNRSHFR